MKFKEAVIRLRPSHQPKGYHMADITITIDGETYELHEFIRDDDFTSRFDACLKLLKTEVLRLISEYEE